MDHLEHLEKEIRQLSAKLNEPISSSAVGVVDEYAALRSNTEAVSEDKALERQYHERLVVMLKKLQGGDI